MISRGIAAVVLATVLAACAAVPEKNDPLPRSADSTRPGFPPTSSGQAREVPPLAGSPDSPGSGPATDPAVVPLPATADDSGAAPAGVGDPTPAMERAAEAAGHPADAIAAAAIHSPAPATDGARPATRAHGASGTGGTSTAGTRSRGHGDAIITDLVGELDAEQSDLWARIRRGFAIADLDDGYVRKWEAWYAERPDYVGRMIDRSRRYLYHVVVEVERRGMPLEVALLPMIESAFNPMAYSRSKASGIWQFIPSTGENFGLRQTWWTDSRRDVLAATEGALDYLEKLHAMFGDWQLALAAYNWGEGSVGRAQAANRGRGLPEDYASLKMPDETRNYLPKLQAVKNIVLDPARFGLALGDIPNFPYFKVVSVDRKMDVKRAAEFAGMSPDDFLSLNPQHNRPVIAGADEHTILLPYDRADRFVARLELTNQPLVSWQAYRLKKGENIRQIADRFDLSVQSLRAVNGIGPRSRVPTGHTLLVPVQRASFEAAATLQHAVFRPVPPSPTLVHRVRRGESLQSIAAAYGVSAGELREWNRLDASHPKAGQRLRILGDAGAAIMPVSEPGPRAGGTPTPVRGERPAAVRAEKTVAVRAEKTVAVRAEKTVAVRAEAQRRGGRVVAAGEARSAKNAKIKATSARKNAGVTARGASPAVRGAGVTGTPRPAAARTGRPRGGSAVGV